MKCFNSASRIAFLLLVILGLTHVAAAGEQVPFRGSLEGTVIAVPHPPTLSVDIQATGTASHLGRFTVEIPHTVTLATKTAVGLYEFTAANGDTLTAKFEGASSLAEPGLLAIVEVATITGGSGRFAGATGSFTVNRLYDIAAGTTTGSFSGSISSPGSNRK